MAPRKRQIPKKDGRGNAGNLYYRHRFLLRSSTFLRRMSTELRLMSGVDIFTFQTNSMITIQLNCDSSEHYWKDGSGVKLILIRHFRNLDDCCVGPSLV